MSNLSSALDNLYTNFVLRDVLSFITPGAIVFFSFLKIYDFSMNTLGDYSFINIPEVIQIVVLLGIFYIIGLLMQIIREIFYEFWPFQIPARWINKKMNPQQKRRDEYIRLLKTFKETNQYEEKSTQLQERFTTFYQCCGNSCIAFGIASFGYRDIYLLPFLALFFLSYIGYVIHFERRKILMSVILKENDRLKELFSELKIGKKIFDKKIDLIEAEHTPNFQGLNIFGLLKLLRYNPTFSKCLSRYDDNIIRFVLLHEAGHIESGGWLRIENILSVLVLVIIIVFIPIMYFLDGTVEMIVSLIAGVVLAGVACYILYLYRESMKNDEFVADEYAFRKMMENYPIENPSTLIKGVFYAMDSIGNDPIYINHQNEMTGGKFILDILIKRSGLEEDYHPSNEERIKRLMEIAM